MSCWYNEFSAAGQFSTHQALRSAGTASARYRSFGKWVKPAALSSTARPSALGSEPGALGGAGRSAVGAQQKLLIEIGCFRF
jgi:hypothetical protein